MPTALEDALGFETLDRNPLEGEDAVWISQEKYESTTPAHWQTQPVSYFRRSGNNKLILSSDDLQERSIWRTLISSSSQMNGIESNSPAVVAITSLVIHLRTDGLFLWSSQTSRGISIPVGSIATYAPDSIVVPQANSSPELATTKLPALRLDLIPNNDSMDMDGDDGGFAPSLLVHIALAPDSSTDETPSASVGPDPTVSASSDLPAEGPLEVSVAQTLADEAALSAAQVQASMGRATAALITGLTRVQEALPDADQPDSGAEEDLERRIRLPVIHAGSAMTGVDGGADGEQQQQQVRVPGLENFSGWVTAENVHEVMRSQGIEIDGSRDANGGEGTENVELGPGAGSRRQREDEDDEEEEGERVTIWQRT